MQINPGTRSCRILETIHAIKNVAAEWERLLFKIISMTDRYISEHVWLPMVIGSQGTICCLGSGQFNQSWFMHRANRTTFACNINNSIVQYDIVLVCLISVFLNDGFNIKFIEDKLWKVKNIVLKMVRNISF